MRLKRVSPTCVLGTLLTSSLIFLLIQFNLVPLFSRYEGDVSKSFKATLTKKQESLQFDALSKFSKLLINFHVSGFLIDSEVLRSILMLQDGSPFLSNYCTVLCNSRSASSSQFGVISHVDISQKFLEGAKEAGFSHFEVIGQDPRVLSQNVSKRHDIPYHHFFVFKSYLIQLVVFYVRSNRYLWHGRIDWSQVNPLLERWRDDQTLYGNRGDGAYDMMEFAEVKVDNVYFMVPKYPQKFLDQVQNSTFLECNYNRAAKFISHHYDRDDDEGAQTFRSNAKDVLIAAANVLDELKIPFWLSSGTCLSWFRECRIIGHSLDVDLGMKITDYNVQLIPAMEEAGLMLVNQFGKESDSFELSFVKDQLKLDMFFFYKDGDTLWNGGTDTNTGEKFKYVFPWFDLCWTEFVGIKVRVPCQTLSYVEANYGKSWNTKVTSWDWKSSPPNVVPNGYWEKEEWSEVMQVFDIIEVEET